VGIQPSWGHKNQNRGRRRHEFRSCQLLEQLEANWVECSNPNHGMKEQLELICCNLDCACTPIVLTTSNEFPSKAARHFYTTVASSTQISKTSRAEVSSYKMSIDCLLNRRQDIKKLISPEFGLGLTRFVDTCRCIGNLAAFQRARTSHFHAWTSLGL
jgi:hypothetical protein